MVDGGKLGVDSRDEGSIHIDDLLWQNFLSPQCRNCSRDPDHAHLGNTHHKTKTFQLPHITTGSYSNFKFGL